MQYKSLMKKLMREDSDWDRDCARQLRDILDAGVAPCLDAKFLGNYTSPAQVIMRRMRSDLAPAIFIKMVEGGVDPNTEYDGKSLAHYAAECGDIEMLKAVMEAGGDIHARDARGRSPLMRAMQNEHDAAVRMLFAAGGADTVQKDKGGSTILHYAATWRGVDKMFIVQLIRLTGIDINKTDRDGDTALYRASREGTWGNVEALLAQPGINVNAQSSGRTALSAMVRNGQEYMVEALLKAGAEIGASERCPLLEMADTCRYSPKIMKLLSAAAENEGVKLDVQEAFRIGVRYEGFVTESFADFVKAGLDINRPCDDGETLLMAAAKARNVSAVNLLLSNGADALARNGEGMTACDLVRRDKGYYSNEQKEKISSLLLKAEEKQKGPVIAPQDTGDMPVAKQSVVFDMGDDLTCTFNFFTQQVIYRAPGAISVQNFADVQRQESIEAAYAVLKAQNDGAVLPPPPSVMQPRKTARLIMNGGGNASG